MFDNNVKLGEAAWIDKEGEIIITKAIAEIVKDDKLNVIEYNICGDHMHMLLVCTEDERDRIVGKLKGVSSKKYNIAKGITVPASASSTTKGHVPLTDTDAETPTDATSEDKKNKEKKKYNSLWTQKYNKSEIKDDNYLNNTIEYIRNNRIKHKLPENKELDKIKKEFICSVKDAFRSEYDGGFDVVIGNPPYVRAELLGDIQNYLSDNYTLYNPSGDLFSYFYEKSFILLKNNSGLFGFISNTFDKTSAGISLREYLQNEISILKYIDFTEVQIFEGATTYPIIITARKQKNNNCNFQYIKIPKISQSPVIDIDFYQSVNVEQNSLEKTNWGFNSKDAVRLISNLKNNKTVRELYGKCYYGVKTALNEAFIIPKSHNIGNHVKPIYEGKELSKWVSPESVQQLILFESKWTKTKYGDEITEEIGIQKLTEDYPELINHILPLKERAKKRYDKGDFFWELRNCAYYDLFEKPKIVFPNLQNKNKFSFDETGAYINAPAVILPTSDKFLLAILNSKLTWYFLTNICVVRSGGYIEVKPQYFEQIPIPKIVNKDLLTAKTDAIILLTSDFQKVENRFKNYLQSQFKIEKLSKKLQNWHELDFADFIKELSKAIKKAKGDKLSKMDEMEWMDVFETKKAEAQTIKAEIDKIDKEIDQMVYELYGLTDEEIKIVEGGV
ncbi:MAG: hypothetical protein DRJ01_13510 [Bacteroidetes bacterium]|nr:MAG: hypothetical protein DRJ01_13510 [Bacteroidota bacterium]